MSTVVCCFTVVTIKRWNFLVTQSCSWLPLIICSVISPTTTRDIWRYDVVLSYATCLCDNRRRRVVSRLTRSCAQTWHDVMHARETDQLRVAVCVLSAFLSTSILPVSIGWCQYWWNCVSEVCQWGVSVRCVSEVCQWGVSVRCVSEVCQWDVVSEVCQWGVLLRTCNDCIWMLYVDRPPIRVGCYFRFVTPVLPLFRLLRLYLRVRARVL